MEAEVHVEVERKYDVPTGLPVPALEALPGVERVVPGGEVDLEATYFDTPVLALARAGITLRRRTGGEDAGWHLKLPASGDRRAEVRLPLDAASDEVPEPLRDRVRAFVRAQHLVPVAVVRNHRVVRFLQGPDGAILAELCDDDVTAEDPAGQRDTMSWREWEVELVSGAEPLLDAADTALRTVGARRSPSASKLARALDLEQRKSVDLGAASTGELLLAYLTQHVLRLKLEDVRLRSGDTEGVHQMRVAARRLRSALATYRRWLDRPTTDFLRAELQWLGGTLGEARDAQVMGRRLTDLVHAEPHDLVVGPVLQRVTDEMQARFSAGSRDAEAALAGDRYQRLLARLDDLCSAPPFLTGADRPARKDLPRLLESELSRVRRRHRAVASARTTEERDHALHDVRKAAKRLRYAAESAQPALGPRATHLARAAKRLQEVLGEHQDSVVARAMLLEIAARAHEHSESAFTYGRLHAVEEGRAAASAGEYSAIFAQLPSGRFRDWPG